jgi:hypothetical protein
LLSETRGYDFVKLHGDLSREAYARLNAVTRREGIRVIGHAPRNLGLEVMFEERQYALAHAEEFLYDRYNRSTDSSLPHVEAQIPEFARATAQANIWVMPNLTAYKIIALMVGTLMWYWRAGDAPAGHGADRWGGDQPVTNRIARSRYEPMMARYRLLEKLVREFAPRRASLVGTDAMNTGVSRDSPRTTSSPISSRPG